MTASSREEKVKSKTYKKPGGRERKERREIKRKEIDSLFFLSRIA
jgi:hypothetical protein